MVNTPVGFSFSVCFLLGRFPLLAFPETQREVKRDLSKARIYPLLDNFHQQVFPLENFCYYFLFLWHTNVRFSILYQKQWSPLSRWEWISPAGDTNSNQKQTKILILPHSVQKSIKKKLLCIHLNKYEKYSLTKSFTLQKFILHLFLNHNGKDYTFQLSAEKNMKKKTPFKNCDSSKMILDRENTVPCVRTCKHIPIYSIKCPRNQTLQSLVESTISYSEQQIKQIGQFPSHIKYSSGICKRHERQTENTLQLHAVKN